MAKGNNKKKSLWSLLLLLLVVGSVVGGFFTAKYITRNDVFEIIGQSTVTLLVGQEYQDEGARAVSFGRDVSNKIVAENTINSQEEGTYYIKYTVDDIRYRGIERYRIIIVVSDSSQEGSEVADESN